MLSSIFSGTSHLGRAALLALADGSIFHGYAFGAQGHAVAEVVFNTSMTGYQEILTDPSYFGQIVTLTYPHIGNTGVNPEDIESKRVQAAGLVVRDQALRVSNFRAQQDLPTYLEQNNVVAITGVDTRSLTRLIRDKGTMTACIWPGQDAQAALAQIRAHEAAQANDFVAAVTTDKSYEWQQGPWALGQGFLPAPKAKYHVVVVDLGVKQSILRQLIERHCRVTVVPATSSVENIMAYQPDGVLFSNGPGDPRACTAALSLAQALIEQQIPLFGLCLGHQILGLALGAQSIKLKAGHHGANHPVQELATGKVYITSQNHNYALDEQSLTDEMQLTHISLFDRSVQGFRVANRPVMGFQGHPEANPGPRDSAALFDQFIYLMSPSKTA